jgi:hypothetical protein
MENAGNCNIKSITFSGPCNDPHTCDVACYQEGYLLGGVCGFSISQGQCLCCSSAWNKSWINTLYYVEKNFFFNHKYWICIMYFGICSLNKEINNVCSYDHYIWIDGMISNKMRWIFINGIYIYIEREREE